jgi:hypothetical protein
MLEKYLEYNAQGYLVMHLYVCAMSVYKSAQSVYTFPPDALKIQLQISISQFRTDVYVYGVINAGCIARVL